MFSTFSSTVNNSIKLLRPFSLLQNDCWFSSRKNALTLNSWFNLNCRSIVRCNLPRPKENKRKKYSYKVRMTTKNGRAIIMRKILKGRYELGY